jgi:hypothetical protein
MSYSVNGKQYIIGTGGNTMYAFALPDSISSSAAR